MTETGDRLVETYLHRLNGELADLPRARRREVVDEIRGHVAEARSELPAESEADVRNILDRLGEPAEIAAEARERPGVEGRRRGAIDVAALILLLVGGVIVPVAGWFVGLVLLWLSRAWSVRDKLIGTLVLPGGLLIPSVLLVVVMSAGFDSGSCVATGPAGGPTTEVCTGGSGTLSDVAWSVLVVVLLLAPVATTIYLARQRNRALAA